MQTADLAGWLELAETKALLAFLRHRRAGPLQTFLAGNPMDPITQGRAAALHELARLLQGPPEKIKEAFDQAALAAKQEYRK